MFRILIACALLINTAWVQAETKIGYIDTERLFRESSVTQRAEARLQQEFSKREQDLQKMSKQAGDLQQQMEKDVASLSESERIKKERDLANMTRDLQRAQREFRDDLNQRKQEEFNRIHERARALILEIAKSERYDLILENTVYASPRVDLTNRVMKALDQKR